MKSTILLLFLLFSIPILVSGHGSIPEDGHKDNAPSLTLETIFLITVAVGLGILFVLSVIIGIKDRSLLIKMAAIALILLVIDYTYIRYFR